MTGPKWVAGPGHGETQGPTREGHLYTVEAWGITCSHARNLLRVFFPKMPAHPTGRLRGGPKGYRCKAVDPPGTRSITNLHNGSCVRLDPAATFNWGPKGRGKPGPYVVLH